MRRGISVLLLAVLALSAPSAMAHVDPPGCAADHSLVMSMSGLNAVKRNGDVVTVAPTFGNTAANACNITNATVSIAFPLGDGSRGPDVVVATNVTLNKGQTKTSRAESTPSLSTAASFADSSG